MALNNMHIRDSSAQYSISMSTESGKRRRTEQERNDSKKVRRGAEARALNREAKVVETEEQEEKEEFARENP